MPALSFGSPSVDRVAYSDLADFNSEGKELFTDCSPYTRVVISRRAVAPEGGEAKFSSPLKGIRGPDLGVHRPFRRKVHEFLGFGPTTAQRKFTAVAVELLKLS